jgi:hypothetical protein
MSPLVERLDSSLRAAVEAGKAELFVEHLRALESRPKENFRTICAAINPIVAEVREYTRCKHVQQTSKWMLTFPIPEAVHTFHASV